MKQPCLRLDEERKELLTNELLMFMQEKAEILGLKPEQLFMDFTPSYEDAYLNGQNEIIPDTKNLAELKDIIEITDDETIAIIRSCLANEYIKRRCMGKETQSIYLTRQGSARAKSVKKAVNYLPTPTVQYNINAPVNNSAIGENNQVSINNSIETLLTLIETAKATTEEKNEAKNKFLEFLKHPVIAPIVSKCGIIAIQGLKGIF